MAITSRAWLCFWLSFAAQAPVWADTWFSVSGDPLDPAVDTVQVAPDTVLVFGDLRMMKIRTSRATLRQGYDGVPFRSYLSTVQIDCASRSANFRRLELFYGPLWTGPHRVIDYVDGQMPKMVFQDMRPNPVERIVQAACEVDKVQTR